MLTPRQRAILRAVVEEYVLAGQPVGSRTVANLYGHVSSATIRNEMMALEAMGYLAQPHTSAGRVPSQLAYRTYVDALLDAPVQSADEITAMREYLTAHAQNVGEVMQATANAISVLFPYAAVVVSPDQTARSELVQEVTLVSVAQGKALMVLVTDGGVYHDTLVKIPEGIGRHELHEISLLMTRLLQGQDIGQVEQLLAPAEHEGAAGEVVNQVTEAIARRLGARDENQVRLEGTLNLLQHPTHHSTDGLRRMLSRMQSGEWRYLMAAKLPEEPQGMLFGHELGLAPDDDVALLCVQVHTPGGRQGAIGIIGPTRMPYASVLAKLRTISTALEEILARDT